MAKLNIEEEQKFYRKFKSRLDQEHGEELFEYLPDVFYFIKNTQRRFVYANQAMRSRYNFEKIGSIIGKTDEELIPRYLAYQYKIDDLSVLKGQKVINKTELVYEVDHNISWYITSKIPLFDSQQKIIGLAAITRKYEHANLPALGKGEMAPIIEFIKDNYSEQIQLKDLARAGMMTVNTLIRRFKKHFKLTPKQYLQRIRINMASIALAHTDHALIDITLRSGFCDQSHFTREFSKMLGMTPREYRQKYNEQ